MLDAYIIEELRRRQEEDRRSERPVLQIPLPEFPRPERDSKRDEDEEGDSDRGVTIIDYTICQL